MQKTCSPRRFASVRRIGREQWLNLRRAGIGGSDAGAILGLNPYCSAFQVYCDKLGLLPEQEDNEAMRQGRDLEGYVARRFAEAEGKKVRRCGYMLQHPEYDWAIANVDRLVTGEAAGLECKTTSVLTKTKYDRGDIPAQYYVQCMHYMAVTGFPVWYLAVLVLNKALYIFKVDRDEAEIEALLDAERNFWENNVKAGVSPEPDGSTRAGEVITLLHPQALEDTPIELGVEADTITKYLDLEEQVKSLTAERDKLKQHLQLAMGDSVEGVTDRYLVRWPSYARDDFDKKRFRAEHPDLYTQYVKPTSFRKFEIKEIKTA